MQAERVTIYFDGLCQPKNPGGVACYGFVVQNDWWFLQTGDGLASEPLSLEATNNVAEYTGLLKALEWLLANQYEGTSLTIRGDSELVIYQLDGTYQVKSTSIIYLHDKIEALLRRFRNIALEWIPGEENKEADFLTRKAYIETLDKNAELHEALEAEFATEKQLAFLRRLKVQPEKYLSKREAKFLIAERLNQLSAINNTYSHPH